MFPSHGEGCPLAGGVCKSVGNYNLLCYTELVGYKEDFYDEAIQDGGTGTKYGLDSFYDDEDNYEAIAANANYDPYDEGNEFSDQFADASTGEYTNMTNQQGEDEETEESKKESESDKKLREAEEELERQNERVRNATTPNNERWAKESRYEARKARDHAQANSDADWILSNGNWEKCKDYGSLFELRMRITVETNRTLASITSGHWYWLCFLKLHKPVLDPMQCLVDFNEGILGAIVPAKPLLTGLCLANPILRDLIHLNLRPKAEKLFKKRNKK